MNELDALHAEAERRKISRLAHFTPLRNLVHIGTGEGLRSVKALSEDERAVFNRLDLVRLDGYPDHISCSIEYPNAYYFRKKRYDDGEARIFPDWVCLLIVPHHLWREETLLCPHNAAAARGAYVKDGLECFQSMFADAVDAPKGRWVRRGHPDCCPTDLQAEVLVHRFIPLEDVQAIAVANPEQAAATYARLQQLKGPVEKFDFIVAPDFYDPISLTARLRAGQRPVESPWHPPTGEDGAYGSRG